MRIAIIGTGISGLTAAYLLHRDHQISVFEQAETIGGHTATKDVHWQGQSYAIDTGFIVFNDWTYPNFIKLLGKLGVASQPTSMGFSVTNENSALEYSGANLNTLFVQRRNLLSVRHWLMIKDILRFNKEAINDLDSGRIPSDITLGDYLKERNYSRGFVDDYLIPMGSAIWSATTQVMHAFPLQFFVRFFKNHGLLSVSERPQWHVIKGGSRNYLDPLIEGFKDSIFTQMPVSRITRDGAAVTITLGDGKQQTFDHVVLACHSDQALAMLEDPTEKEQSVLGAMDYQMNDVVLHTDASLLPARQQAWSSWNYRIPQRQQALPVLTYNMNILQGLQTDATFCVTLNHSEHIDTEKVLGSYQYAHPVFTLESIQAQTQWQAINGNNTWFCGAYWGNGFHEDGVNSALKVAEAFGVGL